MYIGWVIVDRPRNRLSDAMEEDAEKILHIGLKNWKGRRWIGRLGDA